MMALDLRSGAKVWAREVGGIHPPAVAGNVLFLLSNENKLACLRKDNGHVKWVKSLPLFKDTKNLKDRIVWSGPLLAGNRLILFSSSGDIQIYDAQTGTQEQSFKLPYGTFLPPVVADKTLFILTDNGELLAYG